MSVNQKNAPLRFVIFGASGHIGGPAARYVAHHLPDAELRLVTSVPAKKDQLRQDHPHAECVVAEYHDVDSLASCGCPGGRSHGDAAHRAPYR